MLICILIKQQKHEAINNSDLITHFTKQTLNLNYLLLTLNVTVQLLNYPNWETEKPILFLNFKFSLNGGDLLFWFTFNLAVDLRPKMALTLEILSDQMHTLPRNSAEHTLFLFFASFKRSKSALCHLVCEATCSLRTDKQLGNNVTSVDEYSKIVTVQQLRRWQTRTHCCGNIVVHDVSLRVQTGKHLLRTQHVSEQNQKHFCVPDTKFVCATNVARVGKRGNICVGNNVSATMCPRLPVPLGDRIMHIMYISRLKYNR